eukprot:1090206-Alexandrium_andersonii.AAC.1
MCIRDRGWAPGLSIGIPGLRDASARAFIHVPRPTQGSNPGDQEMRGRLDGTLVSHETQHGQVTMSGGAAVDGTGNA